MQFINRCLILFFCFTCTFAITGIGQQISTFDTSFPVTNRYNEIPNYYSPYDWNRTAASVFNIRNANGKYYLLGNFTDIAKNHGSNLVIDTGNYSIKSKGWPIKGRVFTSIADGNGGFYIGGDFTAIGDSSRKYIAHINSNGQPSSWKPTVDGAVQCMLIRDDTLFMGGSFSSVSNKSRLRLALYSVSGDSLLNVPIPGSLSSYSSINSILLKKDTVFLGGTIINGTVSALRKYRYLNYTFSTGFQIPDDIDQMQFNGDSTVIAYISYGAYIRGVNTITGALKYTQQTYASIAYNTKGKVFGMRVIGNNMYVVGFFYNMGGAAYREGFACLDVNTGSVKSTTIAFDILPSSIEVRGRNVYISGKFTKVNGQNRNHFVILDTADLSIKNGEISPTDPIKHLNVSGSSMLISGDFNGIYSVPRRGFAAVDSATNTVLPWAPINETIVEGKRMVIRGDTLFVLGITGRPSSCMANDYRTELMIFRLSTGARLYPDLVSSFLRMDDFTIDGSYLYASLDKQVRRYALPSLTQDPTWGTWWQGGGSHNPSFLIVTTDAIYSLGDDRFNSPCTNFAPRRGFFVKYSKATGHIINVYDYQSETIYDNLTFDHGLLVNNKIYVQGYFFKLNGIERRNFAAIDINTGQLTPWAPDFPGTNRNYNQSFLHRSSDLKLIGGKIWFGSWGGFSVLNDGSLFPGFGGIDTLTGALTTVFKVGEMADIYYSYTKVKMINDFIPHSNGRITVAGIFDSLANKSHCSLARFDLPVVFPVSFISIAAIRQVNSVRVNWQTSAEVNSDHFLVQRSFDGRSFSTIGSTIAAGNSAAVSNYSFMDENVFARSAGTIYYRIVSSDKDNTTLYSKVVHVSGSTEEGVVTLYPNPTTSVIRLEGLQSSTNNVRVYDVSGRTIRFYANTSDRSFDISNLNSGVYFIQINQQVYRFVKQ